MAAEQCNHCRPALDVLRNRADSDEVEPLSRESAMTIVTYLLSLTDHKACRCLLKSPDASIAMHQVILDLIELSSSLIETLIEDLGMFVQMEGSGTASSKKKQEEAGDGGDECSLSCDESESMDLDTSSGFLAPPSPDAVKGLTLDDRKEIFHLLPYLLTDQYLFYTLYHKYHGAIPDRRLTADKEHYAENYFDISGFSPPYVLTLAAVRENGLLDRLRDCFAMAKPGLLPPNLAFKLIHVMTTLKRLTNEHTGFTKIYPARDAALKFICALAEEQSESLRDPFMRSCAEQLWVLGRDYLEESYGVDKLGLDLIVEHFRSPYLAPRLTALTQLNMYINACNELLNADSQTSAEDLGNTLSDYLSTHKVLQLLFGPNSHVELLKQCPNLLNFLALYEKISKEDLDCIWSAAQMKHCGRQVVELLTLIIKGLDPQLLLHLFSLLKGLKPSEHTEMTLHLASLVTKMLWSYALCRTSFPTTPNQHLVARLSDGAQERVPTSAVAWSGPKGEKPAPSASKFDVRLELSSGDSTQASTTGGGAGSICEEIIEVGGSKSPNICDPGETMKQSPPALISEMNVGKVCGKRTQGCEEAEDNEEKTEDQPQHVDQEPVQKRARVVVEISEDGVGESIGMAKPLPLEVKLIGSHSQESPGNSSTTTTTESSSTSNKDGQDAAGDEQDGCSMSSDDQSLDAGQRRHVTRLLQHAKFPTSSGLPSPVAAELVNRGIVDSGVGFGWVHTPDSNSGLLENLVKLKDMTNQRGYNDSDSDISSDAATSSDRMNDIDDDDELVAAAAEDGVDNKLLNFMEHLQPHHHHRPTHSSPVPMDEFDQDPDRQVSQHHQAVVSAAALQLHQHSRHILSHLAPHAKSFWQGKYTQLGERELALFDLSLVCSPGHTLLWDLVIDNCGTQISPVVTGELTPAQSHQHHPTDRLSPELQGYALQALEEVVAWAPTVFIKKFFVHGCVERLRSHKSVPIVLRLLRKIMASFRQTWRSVSGIVGPLHFNHGEGEEINPVVWAHNELDLLTVFFDDLIHFRHNQPTEVGSSIERELHARVEFLEYVFSNQGTPMTYQISVKQLDILWDCLSMDSGGEELLHKWLLDQLKSQSQHALNMELLHYILISKVISFKPETLSNAGLAFLQAVLQETNARSPSGGAEAAVQVCLPLIWSAAMRNVENTVAMAAMTFISNYYVRTGGSPQKEQQFIDSCMSHLRFACEAMMIEAQLPSSLVCIQRAILILRSHIDAFRRRHAFYLRMWELEGRGVKSHMQCVPHAALIESIPPIRLTLQAPGIDKKTVIEVSPTDLLGHLRAEVTYWWNNTKKTAVSPQLAVGRSVYTARKTASTPSFSHDTNGAGCSNAAQQDSDQSAKVSDVRATDVRPVGLTVPMNITIPTALNSTGFAFLPLTPNLLKARNDRLQDAASSEAQTTALLHSGVHNPILGALLSTSSGQQGQIVSSDGGGPLRLLCGGRELTSDLDEKSVLEVGLRDNSIIHVQAGGCQPVVKPVHHDGGPHGVAGSHSPGYLVASKDKVARAMLPPDLSTVPMTLLSSHANWQLLMNLIKLLIDRAAVGPPEMAMKCRTWSYRAWEVIQMLPTYPCCVEELQRILDLETSEGVPEIESCWMRLFDSSNLHYFLYSMQCLEMLAHKKEKFVAFGVMKHLTKVLVDRSLFPKDNGDWSEWEVECLTAILRVTYNFFLEINASATPAESISWRATAFRTIHSRAAKSTSLQMVVPTLDMRKFDGIDKSQLVATIMDLIAEFCSERPTAHVCGLLSRLRGLQCAFQLLIALLLNDDNLRREFRFGSDSGNTWLKRVLLDCHDPNLRREVSGSLYRLCRGRTKDGSGSGHVLTPRLTVSLLALLKDAKDLAPFPKIDENGPLDSDNKPSPTSDSVAVVVASEYKEPYGPSPSSYFWLLTSLLESLLRQDGEFPASDAAKKEPSEEEMANAEFTVDLDAIAAEVAKFIIERPFYESKFWSKMKQQETSGSKRRYDREQCQQQTDSGLVGLLQTAISITKFNPVWKFSHDGQTFVHAVFDLIFALPSPKNGRHHPKCQSPQSRMAAYDLLVEMSKGCDENFMLLYKKLVHQNSKESHDAYGWEYWPHDERRAPCGYVGLMNLGATCYMASAVQQLYMIPRFRAALLNARVVESTKHEAAFREMQKMFAFLHETERKAYNPRAFCKAYQMNHQPLNITEQKDMAEFFTDLITKLEEMGPDLKRVVKSLFCGIMSNNVVSLDCPHVSKTIEDFYTVRCQVADMKDLHESLSELTVGDMLEGDNMYTCSQCNKKVRAEKRACFQKLPRILCFNTMRYTFNMITMMKEKVNTHFSFPFRLNMSAFMEENLLPSHASGEDTNDSTAWATKSNSNSNEYELIGVTVHTGTAEGGHYYSFIRDRSDAHPSSLDTDRWYSFNDADVRPWDPAQLAAECFGGELTRQQYDTVAEKYLDLSFEKTNSAYMLFYERVLPWKSSPDTKASSAGECSASGKQSRRSSIHSASYHIELHPDIERWICEDNVRFIQDLTFFDHSYFNFVWQICSHVPATLLERDAAEVTFLSAKLSLNFVLETLLHSKEKASISQWLELIVKDLSASSRACEWFLSRMAKNGDWPGAILMGCPSKSCREVFQKLCYHAILELHLKHEHLYLLPWTPDRSEKYDAFDTAEIGNQSCIGKFIKRLLSLLHTQQAHVETRQLNEYFGLLSEFAKSRPTALTFMHLVGAIHSICTFYTKRSAQDAADVESEEDASDDEIPGNLMSLVRATCGIKMAPSIWSPSVLERLLKLVTLLLDSGRIPGADGFKLRQKDLQAIIGGKGFPFLVQMIRDVTNPNVSGPLILSVCRGNTNLGKKIIETIFDCLRRLREDTEPYLNLLSYFVDIAEKSMLRVTGSGREESPSSASATPADYTNAAALAYVRLILERMWELADVKPVCALKWLERNVSNHRSIVFDALMNSMKLWVERFLLASAAYQARLTAGELLLSLIPSSSLRTSFAAIGKGINVSPRPAISSEATAVLHRVYEHLLWLLRNRAGTYAVVEQHSTHRLVTFFQTMKACLVSKDEKLMVVPYVGDIWNLFHTHMMEKPVKIHANKQALLTFWYMACVDCPEMIQASVKHQGVQQYFMYNYIHVADDDDDLTNSNKVMLQAFYGLMRLFCFYSSTFCELVIRHENMNFACQSVATKDAYRDAREEIFGAIEICCKQPTIKPAVLAEFKERVWSLFLSVVAKSRANFPLLLRFMKISSDTPQDKALLLHHHILPICSDAFCTLHKMHHEASGCNVLGDLSEIMKRFCEILKFASRCLAASSSVSSPFGAGSQAVTAPTGNQPQEDSFEDSTREIVAKAVREWSNMTTALHRLLELLNSFIPPEIRKLSIDCIKEIVLLNEAESLAAILPEIKRAHTHCRTATTIATSVGPYFPKRGQAIVGLTPFRRVHPPRPMFNMCLQPTQLEASKGVDATYDQMLIDYFHPYHHMVDRLLRIAFNLGPELVPPQLLAEVSLLLGCEGVPLHFALFPKLWLDLWQRLRAGKDLQQQIDSLCQCPMLKEYIEAVLVQEQHSLTNAQIYNFVQIFMDKCQQSIPIEKIKIAIDNAVTSLVDTSTAVETILQASSSTIIAPSSAAILRELDRLPVGFSRARGALWALFLLYDPDKLPTELYKGELRSRIFDAWAKFTSLVRDKLSKDTAASADYGESQEASTSAASSDTQCRYDIESKVRRCCSDFMTDTSEIVGPLLIRLKTAEHPSDTNEGAQTSKEEGALTPLSRGQVSAANTDLGYFITAPTSSLDGGAKRPVETSSG